MISQGKAWQGTLATMLCFVIAGRMQEGLKGQWGRILIHAAGGDMIVIAIVR